MSVPSEVKHRRSKGLAVKMPNIWHQEVQSKMAMKGERAIEAWRRLLLDNGGLEVKNDGRPSVKSSKVDGSP